MAEVLSRGFTKGPLRSARYNNDVRRVLRNAGLLFGAATIVGLYFASQASLNPVLRGRVTFDTALLVNLTYYYLWALATPLVILTARRVPIEKHRWWRALSAHTVASVVLTSGVIVAAEALLASERSSASWSGRLAFGFAANFHGLLPTYWLVLLGYVAFDFYSKLRDRELRAAQLEARLSDARLAALKAQLQPHFLFNTLNSISSLMYEDIEAADAMLTRLSDLLRLTIDRDQQIVSVRDEIELVRRYVAIERVRFEERLAVEFDVAPDTESALVPSLMLQPLVENAIRHSIARRQRGGRIRISACARGDRLELSVEDDGPGVPERGRHHKGIGLANTEARLAHLYAGTSTMELVDSPLGGLGVRIVIPFRRESRYEQVARGRG